MIDAFEELYSRIVEEAMKDYMSRYKSDLLLFLNNKARKKSLMTNLKNNNYSALAIVDFFLPFLNNYKYMSKVDWLQLIYDYTLQLSYPRKIDYEIDETIQSLIVFYLNSLRLINKFIHENRLYNGFLNKYPLSLLTDEELKEASDEYYSFLDAYNNLYIYELMYMDMNLTGHNTLEHLVGVNHLAMFISRQLKSYGLAINLGTVAASSLAHDIGKYGVLDSDSKKVPYYHYYYTEEWYRKNNMPEIGHIASNHSTWDLELENLSLESLILIYCDFRVKNEFKNKKYQINIFPLRESYSIVLNKLDNLNKSKEQRYSKVYKKLKDFEDYMHFIGINTDPNININTYRETYHDVFMKNEQIVSSFKYLAIENNIYLMSQLTNSRSFNKLLESVRSEYNWRKLRMYLEVFSEYSTYLTKDQKLSLINFLMDLLFHKEEDIRKESSILIGLLISDYDEDLRKELPPSVSSSRDTNSSYMLFTQILNTILYPDHKYSNSSIDWQYNLKNLVKSLFINSDEASSIKYTDILSNFYIRNEGLDEKAQVYLAQTTKYIPYGILTSKQQEQIYSYIESLINSDSIEIRLTILDIIDEIYMNNLNNDTFNNILRKWLLDSSRTDEDSSIIYLKHKLGQKLDLDKSMVRNFELDSFKKENLSSIFLSNLKTATNWMDKKINIDILYDQVLLNPREIGLHTGMHFCNLLKVSAVEKVRNYAGHTLINIFPYLSIEEKNDIVIELLRALEMQNYQFTKYIPKYLGRAILNLEESELSEIIDDLEIKIKTSNIQTSFLILQLAGYSIEYFSYYNNNGKNSLKKTLNRLIGILLIGMASFKEDIKMEAFRILSTNIFNSRHMSLEDKYYIFNVIAKKTLTLLPKERSEGFSLLNRASSFNNIYRFIVDYEFKYSNIELDIKTKYAFFPGSFDPFTNGHKEIVKNIRDLGFKVYLAIDEFSWSKRTQAHNFRKDIVNMSLANEKDIFIFPSEIPINISNDKDLEILHSLFDSDPYIVIGVDVLLNASAYKDGNKITKFPHIVIDRPDDNIDKLKDKLDLLSNDTIFLDIDKSYRDVSSTKIRNRIDLDRDISDKIDPLAEEYIYEHGLYIKQPEYKLSIQSKTIEYNIYSKATITSDLYKELAYFLGRTIGSIQNLVEAKNSQILLLRNSLNGKLLGLSIFHKMNNIYFLDEFNSTEATEYLRTSIKGNTLVISFIYSPRNFNTLLNETLLYGIQEDFNYSIIKLDDSLDNEFPIKSIRSHGFLPIPNSSQASYIVDMSNPITFSENIEILLKPPFDKNPSIKKVIEENRIKLKNAITDIFPGELIVSISRDMIYSKMIEKICTFNRVKIVQDKERILGKNICIPFGNILNDNIVPNTVTKTLHTEKIFSKDLKTFTIENSPNYLSIANQTRVLRSFNRPVILVDDILHKGYRLESISPHLARENLDINCLIVGILSGKGLEIAKKHKLNIDAAYFIPNLKIWLNESSLVPFLGGDMVDMKRNNEMLLPSINFILPYANPRFIKGNREKIFYFSKVALENSISLFEAIEDIYQEDYMKSLLIRNLGEILTTPRLPDIYNIIDYSASIKPSEYLKEDLNKLYRIL